MTHASLFMGHKIKFRGKTEQGKWLFGDLLQIGKNVLIVPNDENWCDFISVKSPLGFPSKKFKVIAETVGQFTGLKDKNGREIYDGDIIREKNGQHSYRNMTVEWKNNYAAFCIETDDWILAHYFGESYLSEDIEVIGNIHDNPELLESKKIKNLK